MKNPELRIEAVFPYVLHKVNAVIDDVVCPIEGIDLDFPNTVIAERINYKLKDIKLLLRPLSDIDKEIEHNGEKFVPIEKIAIYNTAQYLIYQIQSGFIEVIVFEQLIKWHYDVFGLIDHGLAENMNTYKSKY